jgi:hypothetical protein
MLRRIRLSAHTLFAIIGGLTLATFLATVPAGFGLDEQSHVARSYQLSQGGLVPEVLPGGDTYGGDIPTPIYDLEMVGFFSANSVDRGAPYFSRADFADDVDEYRRASAVPVEAGGPMTTADFTNAGASSFFAYAAPAVGMKIGLVLGLDAGGIILASKIVNALLYLVCGFFAVRLLAAYRVRWLFFVVALIPQALFQASYVTADTYSNAIVLLFLALTVRLALDEKTVRLPKMIALGVLSMAIVTAKPTYFLLVACLFIIPAARYASTRIAWLYRVIVSSAVIVGVAGSLLITRDIAAAIKSQVAYASEVDSAGQVMHLLQNPLDIVGVLMRTIDDVGATWVEGSLGLFGYNTVSLPQPFLGLLVVALAFAAFYAMPLRVPQGVILAVTGVATAVAAIFALYLTFTQVGAPSSIGVQGRYFLPAFIPILLGAASLVPARVSMSDRAASVLFPAGTVLTSTAATVTWALYLY